MKTTWYLELAVPESRRLTVEQQEGLLNRFLRLQPSYGIMWGLLGGLGFGVSVLIQTLLGLEWGWGVLLMSLGFGWVLVVSWVVYELRRRREEISAYVQEHYPGSIG